MSLPALLPLLFSDHCSLCLNYYLLRFVLHTLISSSTWYFYIKNDFYVKLSGDSTSHLSFISELVRAEGVEGVGAQILRIQRHHKHLTVRLTVHPIGVPVNIHVLVYEKKEGKKEEKEERKKDRKKNYR